MEQGSHVLKVFMMSDHIVSIFYIILDEITNSHNKIRIMHWDIDANTTKKHTYATQYSVNFGPMKILYNAGSLQ